MHLDDLIQNYTGTKIPGGKGDRTDPRTLNRLELAMGVAVESEHAADEATAFEIAVDHLTEDPQYYTKLRGAGLADEIAGKTFENVSPQGAYRTNGGRFSSLNAKGHTVWVPHVPPAVRQRIESVGGRITGAGSGYVFTFKDPETSSQVFRDLRKDGWNVQQGDTPGVLRYHGSPHDVLLNTTLREHADDMPVSADRLNDYMDDAEDDDEEDEDILASLTAHARSLLAGSVETLQDTSAVYEVARQRALDTKACTAVVELNRAFSVLPLEDAMLCVAVLPDVDVHIMFDEQGREITSFPDSDCLESFKLDEKRHTATARQDGKLARANLSLGIVKRSLSARRAARARLIHGNLYKIRARAKSILYHAAPPIL